MQCFENRKKIVIFFCEAFPFFFLKIISCSYQVRVTAARSLGNLGRGNQVAIDTLVYALKNDQDR